MSKVYVGQTVQVQMVRYENDVRAKHPDFTKLALICNHWKKSNSLTGENKIDCPQAGEEWLCQIKHDTKCSEPRRGVFFLIPIKKLEQQVQWSVGKKISGEQIAVYRTVCIGTLILSSRAFKVSAESDIPEDCPLDVRHELLLRLSQYVERQARQGKEDIASRLAWKEWQEQLDSLVGGIDITITKLQVLSHKVSAEACGDKYNNYSVLVDGKYVGLFDSWQDHSLKDIPETIEERRVILSNGEEHSFFSEELHVITAWREGRYRMYPEKKTVFSMENFNRYFPEMPPKWAWRKLQSLVVGDTIAKDCPFQWVNDWLTNGDIRFPKARPEGCEWRHMPVRAVPGAYWDLFLSGLEGKHAADILSWHIQVMARKTESTTTLMTQRQQQLGAILSAQMWQGDGCKRVSVGTNLIFHARTASGTMLYIVDNPGVGAIYVFSDKEMAEQLASNAITRTKAIERGDQRIIHREGWQEKVEALLSGN